MFLCEHPSETPSLCVSVCVCVSVSARARARVCVFKLPPPKQGAQTQKRGGGKKKKNVNRKMRRSQRAVSVHALGIHNIHAGLPGSAGEREKTAAARFLIFESFFLPLIDYSETDTFKICVDSWLFFRV